MTGASTQNEQLLLITHQIRELEHELTVARARRKWSNLSLAFGPLLALMLYAMLWVPQISQVIVWAVYIPAIPVVIAFCIAAFVLKRYPGGLRKQGGKYSDRKTEGGLELDLARQRDQRKVMVANADFSAKVRRIAYKEDAYADIDQPTTFRE